MKLTQTHHFCVRKTLQSNSLNYPHCATSSHLDLKFCCLRPGLHICYKYAWHNHLEIFLEISQNSHENNFIKKETLAQVFSWKFCEISKNTFSYRTPPVAASVKTTIPKSNDENSFL